MTAPLSFETLQEVDDHLSAARLSALRVFPYYSPTMFSLTFVPKPGLEMYGMKIPMSVDSRHRCYYDPRTILGFPVDLCAVHLVHEVNHLLRGHHRRGALMVGMPQSKAEMDRRCYYANLANDIPINDSLESANMPIPDGWPTSQRLGVPPGLAAEEYFDLLYQEPPPPQGSSGGDEEAGEGAGAGDPGEGGGQGDPGGDGAGADPGQGPDPGQPEPQEGDGQPGDGDGNQDDDGQQDDPGGGPSSPDQAGDSDGGAGGDGGQGEMPMAASGCGSCAHGQPMPYELEGEDALECPGISEEESDLTREATATKIMDWGGRHPGKLPSDLERWAKEWRQPEVDPVAVVASHIRRFVALKAGMVQQTWSRVNRRQSAYGAILRQGWTAPIPSVALAGDTSGSMGEADLGLVMGAVDLILRKYGGGVGITVISVDAAVQTMARVRSAKQVVLKGGGGTYMGKAIEAAREMRPNPAVLVVVTDGYTDWPSERPPFEVVVALTQPRNSMYSIPSWAHVVQLDMARMRRQERQRRVSAPAPVVGAGP